MGTPYLAELRIVPFTFAPKGWAFANGQILPINQNQALFSLLGTTYGGDGRVTFALPNLQGRAALHFSATLPQGQLGGESTHTVAVGELPSHTHTVTVGTATASQASPAGATWAPTTAGLDLYAQGGAVSMSSSAVAPSTGGGQPHENTPPYLVLNVIIALQGIFPSRS